ncbi:MAG: ABC transporter substrate-binding protein [Gammaproteobacteria bacterium]
MTRHIVLLGVAALCACGLALSLFPPRVSEVPATKVEDPRRVIIFPPVLSGYVSIDEGCDHIVGASVLGSEEETTHDPLFVANPCLGQVPPMTTFPPGTTFPTDPEQVLLQAPDAVLLWPGTGDALEAAGAPVVHVRSLTPAGGAAESWGLLGRLAGKSPRAEALRRATEAGDASVLRAVDSFAGAKPTFLLMWSLDDPRTFYFGPPAWGPSLDLGSLNGINLASAARRVGRADIEQLLLLDPDVIFLNRQTPPLFYDQPVFSALKAVRERRVYRIPSFGGRLERLLPDHPVYLRWAAELLYPRQMARGTRDQLRETYRQYFNVQLDEAALDRALFLDQNGSSAHYGRFRRSGDRTQ